MEKFDVIIVGGGLSGLAAAYTLAQEGIEVLLLERGDYSGAKNVTGGRLYLNPVRELFPDLWKKAPWERFIAHEQVVVMAKERSVTIDYSGSELASEPQSYSVLRAKFDRWLAKQAERKGAMMVTKSRVDDVIIENGQVAGVWAGGDELRSDVVIACDGVLSFTAEKAGLKKPAQAKDFAVGYKEIIELPRETIEARFNLEGDEGAARLFMGEVTQGKFGGGFLYTNKESISLGIVVGIHDLMQGEAAAPDLLDLFKQRPEIERLIKDGNTVEYAAHAVPEGGLKAMGKLFGGGILVAGDAAGMAMNIGITVRGMEYALGSGYFAARAYLKAREKQDFSVAGLSIYQKLLDESFIMKDFNSFKDTPQALDNPRFFNYYPEMVGDMMRDIYAVPDGPKNKIYTTVKEYLGIKELLAMAGDLRRVMKI